MKQNLVLVPGLLCTDALWAPQIAGLGDMAQVMVANHRRHNSMESLAAAILAEAPERFALAGLSMGGYISLEIMRQAPERVERLALLATNARADGPEQAQRRRDFIALARRGKFRGITPQLIPTLIHPDRLEDKALTETILQMARDTGIDGFINQEEAIIGRIDSRPYLKDIACPTIVICGDGDKLSTPELHREMASLIPGAELRMLERCGHLSTLERPDEVTAALRHWMTL